MPRFRMDAMFNLARTHLSPYRGRIPWLAIIETAKTRTRLPFLRFDSGNPNPEECGTRLGARDPRGSWAPDSPPESSRNPNLRPGHVSKIAAHRLRSVSRKVFFPDGFDSPRKPKIGRSDGNHSRPVALQRDAPANPVGTLSESPRTSALLQTSPRLAVRGLRAFPRRPPAPRPTPSALWILPAPNHFLPIWDSGLSESLRACYRESSAPRFRALPRRAARRLPRGFRKRHAIRTRRPECVVSVFGACAIAVSRHARFETISHPHRM